MQYNNNKTPFSNKYSNQNNKKILDAIDELQEEVDTLSSSLDGVSSSLASKADAQTTASDIQAINSNISSLSNALTSLRDDIKSGDIGKIDDIEVDNISVNDEIKAKSYEWKEGEELSINKVLVPKNGSIYFVYSGIKTALIQYNASNNFIVLSSSNGFVEYGNYNNELAFAVSESSYINYIGDISITAGNITNEVLTKTGTTVAGDLYASIQEANINNLTVANLSATVIVGDDVRADNITAEHVTADEITADVGNIEDLESDAARIKELNTSQINTKVDIEDIGYTIIPEHQSGTEYLVVVPETNGTWNLELPGYFKATIIKTKDAAVVTYNRASTTALSKVEVKDGKLYFFTEGYGKLYFANDSLENDNTVATYTENPPYTEPDETLELTANNGTVNTTRAYFNNVTIYGSMSIRDYSADKINTSKNDTDATFYPTFVDSNNENEDAEKLYTNDTFTLNPYEGKVTTCVVCASDCVETPLVNADLVCADICSDVINTNCLNSTTITNTGNVGTCTLNVTDCATIRNLNVAEQTETGSLVVNNDAFIKGDLWVDGTTHTVDEETITTQSDTIVLRANNNTSLGDNLSGIVINKYNGTDDLGIVTDADGTLRVGTGTGTETSYPAISYNSTTNKWYTDPTDPTTEVTPVGNLTSWATKTEDGPYTNYTNAVFTVFDKTSLEPVMTRDESTDMTDGQIVCWDSTGNKAKTTNCISDNVTFAKCVDIECNLTVDGSICACSNIDTPVVNATCANVSCCLTACNATFTDSVTICCDLRVCGSAIIHGLTSDCVATQSNNSNAELYPTFVCRDNAQQQGELLYTDAGLHYNPFTNQLITGSICALRDISCFNEINTLGIINIYANDFNYWTGHINNCGTFWFCSPVGGCHYLEGATFIANEPACLCQSATVTGSLNLVGPIGSQLTIHNTCYTPTYALCHDSNGFKILCDGIEQGRWEDGVYYGWQYGCQYISTTSSNGNFPLLFVSGQNGSGGFDQVYKDYNYNLKYNPSTGTLTATCFVGNISGVATNADKAVCLTDGTAVFKAEYSDEFNMYTSNGNTYGWINYRGGANTVRLGNGAGNAGFGTLVAGAIIDCGHISACHNTGYGYSWGDGHAAAFTVWNDHVNYQSGQSYVSALSQLSANGGWFSLGVLSGYDCWGITHSGTSFLATVDGSGNIWSYGYICASTCFYSDNITAPVLRNACQTLYLGENSIALGKDVVWNDAISYNVAIGYKADTCGGSSNIAIGPQTKALANCAVAIGGGTCATEKYAIAIGDGACATCVNSVAIGPFAGAARASSIAIGNSACSIGETATAIGHNAVAYKPGSVAIGCGARTSEFGGAQVIKNISLGWAYGFGFAEATIIACAGAMKCDIFNAFDSLKLSLNNWDHIHGIGQAMKLATDYGWGNNDTTPSQITKDTATRWAVKIEGDWQYFDQGDTNTWSYYNCGWIWHGTLSSY